MTEEVQDKAGDLLVKMIDVTIKSIEDVIEFSKQQLPEVINQLLMWKIAESFVWLFIGVVVLIVGLFFCNHYYDYLEKSEKGFGVFVRVCGSFCTVLISSTMIVLNLLDILFISVAPKVWLIEYAAKLMNK